MSSRTVGIYAAIIAVAVAAAFGVGALYRHGAFLSRDVRDTPGLRPSGERVKVEVLNATRTRGLARRATLHLRDKGFDVVEIGNASEQLDTTLVLDRSNHPDWARQVAAELGVARVESRPDSSRYLDVTVLVGASWSPPTKPFYP